MRRLPSLLVVAVIVAALLPAGAAVGAGSAVTGTVVTKGKIALGADAVAVVTLVDQEAGGSGGAIVGQQRISGAQFPVAKLFVSVSTLDEGVQYRTNRSSAWTLRDGAWKLAFHQGTRRPD